MCIENRLPKESELITEELKRQMIPVFSKLKKVVILKAIIDCDDEKCMELAGFLNAITSVSDKVKVSFFEKDENKELEEELTGKFLPVTGIYDETGAYSGACFHGVPGGKEINSFLAAICNYGGAGQKIERRLQKSIDKISKKVEMKIFVSLACHHCPHVVAACQKLAMANPYIKAEMFDARLYPELIEKYKIERVPMTVIDDQMIVMGQKTIDEFVEKLTNRENV